MCAIFPAGDGADIVDTCTQALIRLRAMWYADHPEDDTYDPEENREDREDPFDDNVVDIQRAYYG